MCGPRLLALDLLDLRAHAFFLAAQFGRELRAEVLRLEHLADLDLGLLVVRIRAAFEPLDRFFPGTDLPQPESRDQLLRLGERTVDHRALGTGEAHPNALRTGMQPLAGEHDSCLREFLV